MENLPGELWQAAFMEMQPLALCDFLTMPRLGDPDDDFYDYAKFALSRGKRNRVDHPPNVSDCVRRHAFLSVTGLWRHVKGMVYVCALDSWLQYNT